jgi:hypothetical protein
MIRWPGHVKPGEVSNEIVSGLEWCSTSLGAAGDPDVKDKLLKGYDASGKHFKVRLDGYNQLPYLAGQQPQSARNSFFYFNDDPDLVALRYDNWKIVFEEQRAPGTLLWASRSAKYASPNFATCTPIPTSGRILLRIPIGIGCSITPPLCMAPRRTSPGSWRPSRNSRQASALPPSLSTRQWRS